MPSAADAYDWEGFVEALRETRSLKPLWGRPGFPSIHLYYRRMKADSVFAASVSPLLPRWGERGRPPEEAYQLALQRLQAGAKLRDVAYNEREPPEGRPSRKEFARRRRTDPAFGAAVEQALRSNGRSSVAFPPQTWAWVLEQAAALRSIVAVSQLPGAPRYISIRKNMDRDPAFRAAMLEHCELGTWERVTEAHVEKAVAAIEAGATLSELDRLQGVPGRKAVMRRVSRSPELLRRVRAHRKEHRAYSDDDRRRVIELVRGGATISSLAAHGLPKADVIWDWRQNDAAFAEALGPILNGGRTPFSPAAFQQVLHMVREGQPLYEVAGRGGLPGQGAIAGQRRRDPVFDAQLTAAMQIYGRAFGGEDHFRSNLRKDRLYSAIDKVVRSAVAPFIWDEVRSEMLLAVLEGEIEESDISRQTARAFAADYNRQAGTNKSRSIDATFGDSTRTMHDTLSL